jgi:hypothetical protein
MRTTSRKKINATKKITYCNRKKRNCNNKRANARCNIKNRVTKQRKLFVAIAKQHYCNNKNKKEMPDATSQKKTSATKKIAC